MKYLKAIDLCGTRFHLTIFKQTKYKTGIGGIMTIISLAFIIIFTFIYSEDFLFKKNPTITSSILTRDDYRIINATDLNIMVGWRIENIDGENIDFEGKIFPKIYYYSSVRNLNNSSEKPVISEEYLSFYICNDTELDKSVTKGGNLYCIDWGNKPFGGYWDNYFVSLYEIQLYYCPDGKLYSPENNCTSIKELTNIFRKEKGMYFTIYYPIYYFNPLNIDNPIVINYNVYYFRMSHTMQRTDRINLKEISMIDDQGVIFEAKRNITEWVFDDLKSDYIYYPEEELERENTSSKFYSLCFYLTKDYNSFQRKYMKFQDIIPFLGSIVKIVFGISNCILFFLNRTMKDADLLNLFFTLKESKLFTKEKNTNYHNNSIQITNKPGLNNTNTDFIKTNGFMNSYNLNSKSLKPSLNNQKKYIKFTFGNIFLYTVLRRCYRPKDKYQLKHMYLSSLWLFSHLCDISQYLTLFKDMFFVKNAVFDNRQLNAIKFIKKLNINDNNDLIIGLKENKINKKDLNEYYFYNKEKKSKQDELITQFIEISE